MNSGHTTSTRLPWQGMLLVLFAQAAIALESQKPIVRMTFLGVMLATILIQVVPWRLELSLDRARMFATVGIVGYVFYGLPRLRGIFSGTAPEGAEELDRFFTGLVLLFTVHQLGAFLRLGAGGTVAPVLICSGVHMIGAASARSHSRVVPWLVVGWALLGILALRAAYAPHRARLARRLWTRTTVVALSIFLTFGAGLSISLPILQRMMESASWQLGGGGRGGSSHQNEVSKLGTVQSMKLSDRPVMRLEGRGLIGMHLRAAVYPLWVQGNGVSLWKIPQGPNWYPDVRPSSRSRLPLASFDAERGYGVGPLPGRESWGGPSRVFRIGLDPGHPGTQRPTPLGTSLLRVPTTADSELHVPAACIVRVRGMDTEEVARRYAVEFEAEPWSVRRRVALEEPRAIADPGGRAAYLGRGSDRTPDRIAALARDITAGIEEPFEQALALERWFADEGRFTYSLEVPAGQDLETFLFEPDRQFGWCEYYASAMAVMLRAIDIPSRYVTGYLATEYNPVGDYVIVRERDAHAWVEAFFREEGWRTFDPTPPSFRDAESQGETGLLGALFDAAREQFRRILAVFSSGGLVSGTRAVLGASASVLVAMIKNPLVIMVVMLLISHRIWRAMQRKAGERAERQREEEASGPPAVRALRRSWGEVLELASGHGVPVLPGDTPRRVLARLDQAGATGELDPERIAPLVELIYATRYAGQPLEEEAVAAVTMHTGGS